MAQRIADYTRSKHSNKDARIIFSSPYSSPDLLLDQPHPTSTPENRRNLSFTPPTRQTRPHSTPAHSPARSKPRKNVGRPSRPTSFTSTTSAAGNATATTKKRGAGKSLYQRDKRVLCVVAFPNGSRESHARITAPDISQLMDECTRKLGLQSAARRLFLSDGTEVVDPVQLPKNCHVYVSKGEPFRFDYSYNLTRLSTYLEVVRSK